MLFVKSEKGFMPAQTVHNLTQDSVRVMLQQQIVVIYVCVIYISVLEQGWFTGKRKV